MLLSFSSLSFWQEESLNDIFCWLDAVRHDLWVKNVREKPINLLSLLRIIPIQEHNRNTSTLLAPFHSKLNTEKQMKWLSTNKCLTATLPGSLGDPQTSSFKIVLYSNGSKNDQSCVQVMIQSVSNWLLGIFFRLPSGSVSLEQIQNL